MILAGSEIQVKTQSIYVSPTLYTYSRRVIYGIF